MMREAILLAICFVATSQAVDSEYLAVMGRELRPGMTYHIDIMYPGRPSSTKSVTAIVKQGPSYTTAEAWSGSRGTVIIDTSEYTGRISIEVPHNLIAISKYYVHLEFDGKFDATQNGKEVEVVPAISLIFIQTDKGIYKSGETVNFRILYVDEDLVPKIGAFVSMNIKDPNNNTVYDSVLNTTNTALATAAFDIPRDPYLGTWMATAEGEWGSSNVTFEVSEYVLPRFEVELKLEPSYVVDPFYFGETNGDVMVRGKVKAVYTYGAYVKGAMTVTLGNDKQTFSNFDGEEPFSFTVSRERGDDRNELEVFAEMTERYTKERANDTRTFSIYDAEYRVLVIKPIPNTIEGSSDYTFFAQLVNPSGRPVENYWDFEWTVDATLSYMDERYYQKEEQYSQVGQMDWNPARITLTPDLAKKNTPYFTSVTVNIREKATGRMALPDTFVPVKYESTSGQALFIDIIDKYTENLMSNTGTYNLSDSEVCFRVRTSNNQPINEYFYQVIGNFEPLEIQRPSNPQEIKCLPLELKHAPKSMIMAYMLYEEGDGRSTTKEYLVASVTISVEWHSPHQVSLTVHPETQYPNEQFTLRIQTEGAAVVGLGVIDQSLTYLAKSNDITNARLQSAIEEFQIFGKETDTGSNHPGPMPMFRSWIWPGPMGPEKTSAGDKLKEAGLTYITSVELKDNTGRSWDKGVWPVAEDAAWLGGRDPSDGGNQNVDTSGQQSGENDSGPQKALTVRTKFPETWLFDIVDTDGSGRKEIPSRCPGTITTWLFNAFAVNDLGTGVAPTAELRCFQPFFVTVNLPYSIVRGENFDLQMIVFNYNNQNMDVELKLIPSADFDVLNGVPMQTDLLIEGGSSRDYKIPIRAKIIGSINIVVEATGRDPIGNPKKDVIQKPLLVKAEGKEVQVSQEQTATVVPGEIKTLTYKYSKFFIEPEEDVVKDSLRMDLYISGDMMAEFVENLEKGIGMPVGCGEQNMETLIPSIMVARYLKGIGRFNADFKLKVGANCAKGYAKELIYMHLDGGFSAFGDGQGLCGCGGWGRGPIIMEDDVIGEMQPDKPKETTASSWLTAFVVKTFSIMAKERLTFVSHDLLGKSYEFLTRYIDRSYNAESYFIQKGSVIHKEMQGGTAGNDGKESHVTYSASVFLAMVEYNTFRKNMTESSRRKRDITESKAIIDEAVSWMKRNTDVLHQPFSLAIVAYAFARAGEYDTARTLLSRGGNFESNIKPKCPEYLRYSSYCPEELKESESTCTKGSCQLGKVCCQQCGRMICMEGERRSGPSDIEAKGYALLAYLYLDDRDTYIDQIRDFVDWLMKRRGFGGKYHSTQDTVVALESLSEYAGKYHDEAVADFIVSINSPSVSVTVNRDNYEIQEKRELDINWVTDMNEGELNVNVQGNRGTAFIQLVARYNSLNNETAAQRIILDKPEAKEDNTSLTHITTCIQLTAPTDLDPEELGDMFIAEISLQSGMKFAEAKVDLGQLEKEAVVKLEYEQGKIVLYFEFKAENKYLKHCVIVPAETEFEVRDRAMAKVAVYDYYTPETKVEAFYSAEPCVVDCGYPTTPGPITGASSVYISSLLMVVALMVALGVVLKRE